MVKAPERTISDVQEETREERATLNIVRPKIMRRFADYTSAFWSLAIPTLSARYLGRYVSALGQWDKLNEDGTPKNNFFLRRGYGFFVGGLMTAVTSFYAFRTWQDIKDVFAEPLAWEFNKDPKDVGLRDFLNSKNTIAERTIQNFGKYNFRRFLFANLSFFNFLIPWVGKQIDSPDAKKFDISNSVDFGVGMTGAYLISDVMSRKETFFERLQLFADRKINHTERGEDFITANDLINLYQINERDHNPSFKPPHDMTAQSWKDEQKLFGRMADLMNQSYGNKPNKDKVNFTISDFLYLVGHGLVKTSDLEPSLAYVEVAARGHAKEVNAIAAGVKANIPLDQLLAQRGIVLPKEQKREEGEDRVIDVAAVKIPNPQKEEDRVIPNAPEKRPHLPAEPVSDRASNFIGQRRKKEGPAPHDTLSFTEKAESAKANPQGAVLGS